MGPTSQAVQESFRRFLGEMGEFFGKYSSLRETESGLRAIAESTRRPFNVAIFGRMKTGKSTLINALVGRPLAITGVEEATATINWISHGDEAQANSFIVHWKDGRSEPLPLSRMAEWAGKDEAVLARVRATSHLELFADADALKRVQVIDTPGTGSVAEEHEKTATSFLDPRAAEDSVAEGRKADALIYVLGRVGRGSDADALRIFREGCLPGSDPYNSVGVVHQWDDMQCDGDILEEIERKAERLRKDLKGVVADVIPVSGPIALLSRHAPDTFFRNLAKTLEREGNETDVFLAPELWNEDDARRSLLASYPELPFSSFRLVGRLFLKRLPGSVPEFRQACLDFSQITRLESFLDKRFFSQAAIIKQRQGRVRAKALIEPAFDTLSRQIETLRNDVAVWPKLEAAVSTSDNGLTDWVRRKTRECETELEQLDSACVRADRFWMEERDRMEGLDGDLRMSRRMDRDSTFVDAADAELIRRLCEALCVDSPDRRQRIAGIAKLDDLTRLRRRYGAGMQAADSDLRGLYSHLSRRLLEAASAFIEESN